MSEPAYAVRLSHAIVSKSWRQIIEKVIAFEEKLDDGGFIEVTEVCWSHRKRCRAAVLKIELFFFQTRVEKLRERQQQPDPVRWLP